MAKEERKEREILKIAKFLVLMDKVERILPRPLVKSIYAAGNVVEIEILLRKSFEEKPSLAIDWLISTLNPYIVMCKN